MTRSPTWLMLGASLLFSLMGVCVKYASARYGAGEIVFYRSVVGMTLMLAALRLRGTGWRTPVLLSDATMNTARVSGVASSAAFTSETGVARPHSVFTSTTLAP